MRYFNLLSIALAAIVLVTGLYLSTTNIAIFFDPVSIFIVFGGTLAATAVSFKINKFYLLIVVFLRKMVFDVSYDYAKVISDLMKLSEANRAEAINFDQLIAMIRDPFLKDAMITFTDQVLDKQRLMMVLRSRAVNIYKHYLQDANKFRTIGRFPPAFGLMGTTIGMIVLLSNLAEANAVKLIGPAMSICLVTTLYGVALANLFIIPIAESLTIAAKEQYFKNTIIVEGVRLIYEKTNPVELAEILNAYLRPAERMDWKRLLRGAQKNKKK
ncbi:MAG: MotA/TolQ/ExbB proton channel family protein [Bacteriovoracaceae bacterium]|nr:MotA/TolQ/ExbB proton channel family protein [Bacteriovoracaceae bacterium]